MVSPHPDGPVAQLGARLNGIQEVTGSIPVRSTILRSPIACRASLGRSADCWTRILRQERLRTLTKLRTPLLFPLLCLGLACHEVQRPPELTPARDQDVISDMAFTTDGTELLVGSDDGWLYRLSLAPMRFVQAFRATRGSVSEIALGPGDLAALTTYRKCGVQLVNHKSGRRTGILKDGICGNDANGRPILEPDNIWFDSTSGFLIAEADQTVRFDLISRKAVDTCASRAAGCIFANIPPSKFEVRGSIGHGISYDLHDPRTNMQQRLLLLENGLDIAITEPVVSDSGQWMVVGNGRGVAWVFALPASLGDGPLRLGPDLTLKVHHATGGWGGGAAPYVAFSPDGQLVAIAETLADISVFELPSGTLIGTRALPRRPSRRQLPRSFPD